VPPLQRAGAPRGSAGAAGAAPQRSAARVGAPRLPFRDPFLRLLRRTWLGFTFFSSSVSAGAISNPLAPVGERLARRGHAYTTRVEHEISQQLGLGHRSRRQCGGFGRRAEGDRHLRQPHEVRLIYMGASERNLRERFFYGNPIEQVLRDTPATWPSIAVRNDPGARPDSSRRCGRRVRLAAQPARGTGGAGGCCRNMISV